MPPLPYHENVLGSDVAGSGFRLVAIPYRIELEYRGPRRAFSGGPTNMPAYCASADF